MLASLLIDEDVEALSTAAGDGLAAKLALMPLAFPEVQQLIDAGPQGAEAMLAYFQGTPDFESQDDLILMAYALEQIDYFDGLDRLTDFLETNITGDVPAAVSAVTHTARWLLGMPRSPSCAYVASEIEATIDAANAELADSMFGAKRLHPRKGQQKECHREFVLVDANGQALVYPAGHPKGGQPITVGGTIRPATDTVPDATATDESNRVEAGSGTYVNYTDPESGVTYEGKPTRLFNCAGFAFRHFNDGMKWNADPGAWFDALNSAGALETRAERRRGGRGRFCFLLRAGRFAGARRAGSQPVDALRRAGDQRGPLVGVVYGGCGRGVFLRGRV